MLGIDIKLLPFQGVTNERTLTQGVASLALGYALHWAFSPPLLNPKLQLLIVYSLYIKKSVHRKTMHTLIFYQV